MHEHIRKGVKRTKGRNVNGEKTPEIISKIVRNSETMRQKILIIIIVVIHIKNNTSGCNALLTHFMH